jgi:hypothetical protein
MGKRMIRVLVLTLLTALSVVVFFRLRTRPDTPPPPSVQKIFQDRQAQARAILLTPLANLVQTRDWPALKARSGEPGFGQSLAEVVRAMHVELKFQEWTPQDHAQLTEILLVGLSGASEPELLSIIPQIERLPSPVSDSPAALRLRRFLDPGQPEVLRVLAFKKLVIHESKPEASDIDRGIRALLPAPKTKGGINPFLLVDETRNDQVKKTLLSKLAASWAKIDRSRAPTTLYLLCRNIQSIPQFYSKGWSLTLQSLQSKDSLSIEYGLRSLVYLHQFKKLPPAEVERVVSILTSIPTPRRSPFIQEKSNEIIEMLQR